jgi:hypothetical protein
MNPGRGRCGAFRRKATVKSPCSFPPRLFQFSGHRSLSPLGKASERGHAALVRPRTRAQAAPTGKSNRVVPVHHSGSNFKRLRTAPRRDRACTARLPRVLERRPAAAVASVFVVPRQDHPSAAAGPHPFTCLCLVRTSSGRGSAAATLATRTN